MAVAPPKPNPTVAAMREVRGQLVSGMAVAPPARGHALLPPSDRWPEVCARSAGASAFVASLVTMRGYESVARPEVCARSAGVAACSR